MIDYDKLKLAYNLSQDLKDVLFSFELRKWVLQLSLWGGCVGDCWEADNLDDLIAKLQELTALQEPKANLEGWVIDGFGQMDFWTNIPPEDLIKNNIKLYPTKSALIEAQIAYWQKLKQENCEHDFNSVFYDIEKESYQGCSKCHLPKPSNDSSHIQEKFCTRDDDMSTASTVCKHDGFLKCRRCNHEWSQGFEVIDKELIKSLSECQHAWSAFKEENGYYIGKCTKCGEKNNKPINFAEECEHENNGTFYAMKSGDDLIPSKHPFRCKKCGEFYR